MGYGDGGGWLRGGGRETVGVQTSSKTRETSIRYIQISAVECGVNALFQSARGTQAYPNAPFSPAWCLYAEEYLCSPLYEQENECTDEQDSVNNSRPYLNNQANSQPYANKIIQKSRPSIVLIYSID